MHATLDQEATDRPDNHTQLKAPLVFALRLPCTPDGHRVFIRCYEKEEEEERGVVIRAAGVIYARLGEPWLPTKQMKGNLFDGVNIF